MLKENLKLKRIKLNTLHSKILSIINNYKIIINNLKSKIIIIKN